MKEKLKNKKVVYTIIGVISLLLVALAITYAYWLITRSQTKENVITSACLDISLTNEQNDITLTKQFPISDEEGMELTPYIFTITNNCDTEVDYHINLESIGTESEAVKALAIKAVIDDNEPQVLSDYSEKDTTIEDAYEAYLLGTGTLAAKDTEGSSTTHSLRLWIDENAPISEMKKTLRSKISVTIGQGIEATQGSTLASLILNHAQTNNYLYSTTPDFSKVTADGEYGLYSAQDDYGTSYYFRGDVEKNYVQFGKWQEEKVYYLMAGVSEEPFDSYEDCWEHMLAGNGGEPFTTCDEINISSLNDDMYWRIVRINGDGTMRLVYDGSELVANSDNHVAIVDLVKYNVSYTGAKYVGYTYDDGNGNQVDSTIKGVVDTWYKNNLETHYGKYLAAGIYCNDRNPKYKGVNTGIETTTPPTDEQYWTYYAPYTRLYINKSPVLTCTTQSDRYIVEDTAVGNGLLTKPVGLMTADEIVMAGGVYNISNKTNYLYSSLAYWTLSPYKADIAGSNYHATAFKVLENGSISMDSVNLVGVSHNVGARPVINLKADVLFTGTGTIDDPYIIVTD